MAEKCQVCGGKVVNGRCSLCGMPYRNDDVLYHLNEPREVHYKHASAKVREMMRGYGTADRNAGHGSGTGTSRGRMQEHRQQSAGKNPVMKQTGTLDKGRTTNQGRTVNQRGILNHRPALRNTWGVGYYYGLDWDEFVRIFPQRDQTVLRVCIFLYTEIALFFCSQLWYTHA